MNIDKNVRIVAFSDVHGDLDALISCLRDCAKVISCKKNNNHLCQGQFCDVYKNYARDFDLTTVDDDCFITETIKEYKKSDDDIYTDDVVYNWMCCKKDGEYIKYPDDLGFKWKGGQTHVVIIGDLIDGYRDGRGVDHLIKKHSVIEIT